ncbi:hypothetical protein FIBSPDRAFT_931955 [Athelia psychrophila]|uniref:DUF6533 domain-containing protein n=1 Tax=Athelia psychrophila TaxID=1759441 RepID=A0A166JJU8_9AGAM|nr:hypothetical protein FIBSPDRAFT_931955 [Fibularhizoctonia sp. CBS 109695]
MKSLDAASSNQLGLVFSFSARGAPLVAQEVTFTAYCSVAVFTALIWTWALCVQEEIEIVQRKGLSMPIIAYYVTRFATMGACLCTVLAGLDIQFDPGKVEPWKIEPFGFAFLWITQSSTGLLFFYRIRAVYQHSKSIRYGFFAMWMLVTVSPSLLLLPPAVRCYMPNKHCYIWGPLTLAGNGTALVNDTLVFIGVSLHAYGNMTLDTSRLSRAHRFKLIIQGNGLYKVSRMLLKSGQLYYGAIVGVQISSTVVVSLGLRYSQIFYITYIPFASTLACKVFRMVMLCDTIEDPLSTLEIHEMFEVGMMGIE